MKIYDSEYNKEKISNENTNTSFEFGNTPSSESESFADNKTNIRDEVNDNPTSNTEKKKEEKKRRDEKKEEGKPEQSSSGSSSSSGSAASGASGAIGAAAVAAASVLVAVASLATLVGIDLTGGGDTPAPINYGEVTNSNIAIFHNKIGYRLQLVGNDGEEYSISMFNGSELVSSQTLTNGKNANYFTGLSESTPYKLTINNVTKSNYTIYSLNLSTIAADEADITLDVVPDIENGTFETLLTYDYSNRYFDNFMLNVENRSGQTKQYELASTDDQQTVTLNEPEDTIQFTFDDPDGFTYFVTYDYDGVSKSTSQKSISFNTTAELTKYKVTLDPGESTDDPIVEYLREGKSFYLPDNPFTVPEGYLFKGWQKPTSTITTYNPGTRMTSYIENDLTYIATFKVDDTPVFNDIQFTNAIDFTQDSFDITVTMDYYDPSRLVYSMTFEIFNPNSEYREYGYNISKNIEVMESQTVTISNIEEHLNLCDGQEYEYKFSYSDYYTGETIIAKSGTVTFVDINGREANASNFHFTRMTPGSSSNVYTIYWSFDHVDTFNEGFYNYSLIEMTPVSGGDTVSVQESVASESGIENQFSTEYYPVETSRAQRYVFKMIDKRNRVYIIDEGTIYFENLVTRFSDFSFGAYYYSISDRTYISFNATINDPQNTYGDLTLMLSDNTDQSNPDIHEYPIEKRSGTQIIDVTGLSTTAFENGNIVYGVTSSATQSYLIGPSDAGEFYQSIESTVPSIELAALTSREVDSSNLFFEFDTLRATSIEGSIANPRLIINDTFTITFDASTLTVGLAHQQVSVPEEDYDGVLNLLKNSIVTIVLKYDVMLYGDVDSSPTRTLCSDTVFTVK